MIETVKEEDRKIWKKIFGNKYYNLVRKPGFGWSVILFSLVLFGLGVCGCLFIPVGLN